MEILAEIFTIQALLTAGYIFLLRLLGMTLDTLRILFVIRGRRWLVWLFGFSQAVIFLVAITSVLTDMDNVLNIIGYAGGVATGNILGMTIERKLAIGHLNISIISPTKGKAISEKLRSAGFAVTEIPGQGKDGMVTIINISERRRNLESIEKIAQSIDENIFITSEDIRPVRRGYWRL